MSKDDFNENDLEHKRLEKFLRENKPETVEPDDAVKQKIFARVLNEQEPEPNLSGAFGVDSKVNTVKITPPPQPKSSPIFARLIGFGALAFVAAMISVSWLNRPEPQKISSDAELEEFLLSSYDVVFEEDLDLFEDLDELDEPDNL